MMIAEPALFFLNVILQLLPDDISVGEEHRQALAHQIIRHEQLHFPADLAVVALSGFLLLAIPLLQLFRRAEGHAVDAGQHLVAAVIPPVGAGLLGNLERFECLGVGQVRSEAHIHILTLLEEAELRLIRQVLHMLDLVFLAALFHELLGLFTRKDE